MRLLVALAPVLAFAAFAVAAAARAEAPRFVDVSERAPPKEGRGHSMAAVAVDIDRDGDLDLVVAMEFGANRLLLNDGSGRFTDASDRLPRAARDSEDLDVVDLDGDGDLDIAVANEDDLKPELYLNDGRGQFRDASERLRVRVKANALLVRDLDGDGRLDLFFGGDKVSALLMGRGRGRFADESFARLPERYGANQDVAAGDLDGDGDLDLVLANEDANQIYLNDGNGRFALAPAAALPRAARPEESRDAELFDVDADGDLDLFFANVRLWNPNAVAQSRLLLNDGKGVFADATAQWLPAREESVVSATPVDLDGDGRRDLLLGTLAVEPGRIGPGPVRALRNTGAAFEDVTAQWLPKDLVAAGFDIVPADFDGDGVLDLFVASRGGPDRLLRGTPR
ncbi:MAG: VCBS repeat-containing protein [Alphaproteobacteria bacterium]|nr:VCBS repeat-containing protein [Alphaproteobacteria bacterium]